MGVFAGHGVPAWKRWHQLLVSRLGNSDGRGGDIIQPLAVASPALFDQSSAALGRYYENMYSDRVPQWSAVADLSPEYVASGASLAKGYRFFLYSLSSSLVKTATPEQKAQIVAAAKVMESASKALSEFEKEIDEKWDLASKTDPGLRRDVWESENLDIADRRRVKVSDRERAVADYVVALADSGHAEATLISEQITAMDDPTQKIKLPKTRRQANEDPAIWEQFYRQEFVEDVLEFKAKAPLSETLEINETVRESEFLESRWSLGGSVNFLGVFRSGGVDASQTETNEKLRADTTSIKVHIDGIQEFIVNRGAWYDENILKHYMSDVDAEEFWGANGKLNLIPRSVIAVRGVEVTVECSSETLDRYENHINAGADVGFWIGAFRVGLAGGYSRDEVIINHDQGSSTMRLVFPKDRPVVIAVRTWRPLDILGGYQPLSPRLEQRLASLYKTQDEKNSQLLSKVRAKVIMDDERPDFRPL